MMVLSRSVARAWAGRVAGVLMLPTVFNPLAWGQTQRLPEIVAHRGASHLAPENTLAAIELAWALDADAAECDVYLSRDGQIVLHHDKSTKRTTGVDRAVAEQSYEELRRLDAGSWKHPRYAGEPIPLLRDVIATIPEGRRLFIEVKCGPEIVEPLAALLDAGGKEPGQTCVISFNWDVVAQFKKRMPHLKVYWLSSFKQDERTGAWSPTIEEVVAKAAGAGVDGVDLKAAEPLLNTEAFGKLREAKLEIHTWTVDDPELAGQLQQLGVDGITTNRPAWLTSRLVKRLRQASPTQGGL